MEQAMPAPLQGVLQGALPEVLPGPLLAGKGSTAPYLKQFSLRDHFPHLAEDVDPCSMFHRSASYFTSTYLWIGPQGAVTGLHNDDEHNFLAQVYGGKRVVMVPPGQRAGLYPNRKYDSGTECCDVDVDARNPFLDLDGEDVGRRFPALREVVGVVEAELRAGDVLYIPRNWYHQVMTERFSISVNHFASDPVEYARFGLARDARQVIHNVWVRVFGSASANCVCH